MRSDDERISDILQALKTITDYISSLSESAFFNDRKTIDAVFLNVIIGGEAVNALMASGEIASQLTKEKRRSEHAAPKIAERSGDCEAWQHESSSAMHQTPPLSRKGS